MPTFRLMEVSVSVHELDSVPEARMPVQCHSGILKEVKDTTSDLTACDGLITSNTEVMLGVHTRDCAPICFSDGEKIAIAHVGWQGLCEGMIESVMAHFSPLKTEVFVGPHLHSFEIQKDFCYDAITEKFGNAFLEAQENRLVFRFKDTIASLLPRATTFDERNTADCIELPSHRHKRTLGHIITTVKFKSA